MKAKTAGLQTDNSSKEIRIQISERDGQQILVIKEQHPANQIGEYAVEIPAALLPELKRVVETIELQKPEEPAVMEAANQPISFAHESEKEFARILDFYHIRWQYEPRSFVTERDAAGNPLRSFTPDFYLPDHDLFIEITTQKQSLVTKKNRKLRQLRELYPEINIKLLYASDYNKLIDKFSASKKRPEPTPENHL
jgi:hypoxanthine phosphoribosyltransferase